MASERIQRRIDGFLDEAEDATARYDWDAVREAAQAVLRLDPDNGDALTFLAAANREPEGTSSTSPTLSMPPSQLQDQPASFANGRYEVKRFLGEGGKKTLHLVTAVGKRSWLVRSGGRGNSQRISW